MYFSALKFLCNGVCILHDANNNNRWSAKSDVLFRTRGLFSSPGQIQQFLQIPWAIMTNTLCPCRHYGWSAGVLFRTRACPPLLSFLCLAGFIRIPAFGRLQKCNGSCAWRQWWMDFRCTFPLLTYSPSGATRRLLLLPLACHHPLQPSLALFSPSA